MANLLLDKWIEAERADGSHEQVAPWQLPSEVNDNPIVDVQAPTRELEAGLHEFLIGVYNTLTLPQSDYDCEEMMDNPSSPKEFREVFEQHAEQFRIFDDHVPFMQEKSEDMQDIDVSPLHLLPLQGPSENAINNHRDWHTKEGFIERICGHCGGLLLYLVQTRAITTNYRYMGTFRTAKHTTTLLIEDTVWETVCSNLTSADRLESIFGMSVSADDWEERSFPWSRELGEFLGDESYGKDQVAYTLEDGHPLDVFWTMPRRFLFDVLEQEEKCDICGSVSEPVITGFRKNTFGLKYEGSWLHTLSPFTEDDEGPEHQQISGSDLVYRDWHSLTYQRPEQSTEPAYVVQSRNRSRRKNIHQLWAYTFHTYGSQNNKIGKFVEGTYPHFTFDKEEEERFFRGVVTSMVKVASEVVVKSIRRELKNAMYGTYSTEENRFKDVNPPESWWENGIFPLLQEEFWTDTEERFFELLEELWASPDEDTADRIVIEWLRFLRESALELFDRMSQRELNTYDRERIFARKDLKWTVSPYNQDISEHLSGYNQSLEELWNTDSEVKAHE